MEIIDKLGLGISVVKKLVGKKITHNVLKLPNTRRFLSEQTFIFRNF